MNWRSLAQRFVAHGPQPHEWLLLALLLGMTHHYFWLMDDAFIYFRYVDNLLFLGRGLVFNAGEYVEGFSSPAWLLLLVPLRALHLDYYTLVGALALGSAAVYGGLLIWVNRQLSPSGPAINFPLAASAAHYGVTSHFSSGLETPLVQVCAALYAAAILRPGNRGLHVLLALSPLVRPELGLVAVLYGAWLLARTRRIPWTFGAALVVGNGVWLCFRIYYYADFLPNTFYLKDISKPEQGLHYIDNVLQAHHVPVLFAMLLALAFAARRALVPQHNDFPRAFMLLLAATSTLYVIRVGGDMLYYRYAAFPMCLLLCAGAGIPEAALRRLEGRMLLRPAALLTTAALTAFSGACYPAQLKSHPLSLQAQMKKSHGIADATWHRQHKSLRRMPARADQDRKQLARYAKAGPAQRQQHEVLVTGFCHRAFVAFDRYVVHNYGLTDATLARLPAKFGRPGHKLVQRQADELSAMLRAGGARGPGSVDRWLARKRPKPARWLRRNADALRLIEQKIYNRHDFAENVRLASTRIRLR